MGGNNQSRVVKACGASLQRARKTWNNLRKETLAVLHGTSEKHNMRTWSDNQKRVFSKAYDDAVQWDVAADQLIDMADKHHHLLPPGFKVTCNTVEHQLLTSTALLGFLRHMSNKKDTELRIDDTRAIFYTRQKISKWIQFNPKSAYTALAGFSLCAGVGVGVGMGMGASLGTSGAAIVGGTALASTLFWPLVAGVAVAGIVFGIGAAYISYLKRKGPRFNFTREAFGELHDFITNAEAEEGIKERTTTHQQDIAALQRTYRQVNDHLEEQGTCRICLESLKKVAIYVPTAPCTCRTVLVCQSCKPSVANPECFQCRRPVDYVMLGTTRDPRASLLPPGPGLDVSA